VHAIFETNASEIIESCFTMIREGIIYPFSFAATMTRRSFEDAKQSSGKEFVFWLEV
jgi:hypothetical protein